MDRSLTQALVVGCERVAAWADLLDEINVFPVADGDTGRNLRISLAPCGRANDSASGLCRQLVTSATGNSGNIAVAFLLKFLSAVDPVKLDRCISAGKDAAWNAVADPKPGTMLTLFDALAQTTHQWPTILTAGFVDRIVDSLDRAVRSSLELLPVLKQAGVVDAGALGMFIFFEGFFRRLLSDAPALSPVTHRFDGLLRVTGHVDYGGFPGYCVNTVLNTSSTADLTTMTAAMGDSVVAVPDGDRLRLHLHTQDQYETRTRLETLGKIVTWQVEPMAPDKPPPSAAIDPQAVHIMTDAAGSLTRAEARNLGITLLDSCLVIDNRSIPETLFDPKALYSAMSTGKRVSTAQASIFQKHQSFESVLGRHGHVLYLTVGSVYTGNFTTACQWRLKSSTKERFTVVDTGAASGRLGLVARKAARFARAGNGLNDVAEFARKTIIECGELIFLEKLKFLVAGGRISRSKGFVGAILGIKPVISPKADGVVKVGTVRKVTDQLPFALTHLKKRFSKDDCPRILLQFSDNEQRVRGTIQPEIQRKLPRSRIMVTQLSLTSGAHMGPGTWGLAFCPDVNDTQ
jgi:DegV family protein with EDD domain